MLSLNVDCTNTDYNSALIDFIVVTYLNKNASFVVGFAARHFPNKVALFNWNIDLIRRSIFSDPPDMANPEKRFVRL